MEMKIKKVLAVVLSVVMIIGVLPYFDFDVDAVVLSSGYYYYSTYDSKTTITGCDESISGSINIPSSLGGYPVTTIGSSAFSNCANITSITIPNSVTYIEACAFEVCINLKSVSIPNSVTGMGNNVFSRCTSLTSITLPNSITDISVYAFSGCSSLRNVTIQNGITGIYKGAFNDCTSLTSINIPSSVTCIVPSLFSGCSSLTDIQVSSDNEYYCDIDGVLFNKEKSSLICYPADKSGNSYAIPDSVTDIEEEAFEFCSSLTSIKIPYSVININKYVFSGCSSLADIQVSADNEVYCDIDGVLFSKGKSSLICYPARKGGNDYTIPDGVTDIESYAFELCGSLTSIKIPNSVISIESGAFKNCTSLTNIKLSNSITSINPSVFLGCSSLTSITIPDGVINIDNSAFSGCTSLVSLIIPKSVTNIDWYAFKDCVSLKKVYYWGTEEEWNIVDIFKGNDYLLSAGKVFTNIENFDYTIKNNTVTLTKYNGSETDVVIPQVIDGYPVVSVGTKSFMECKSIKNVIIPEGITTIGFAAFHTCSNLEYIYIPSTVNTIGGYPFVRTTSLKNFEVSKDNKYFTTVDGVLFNKDKTELISYPGAKDGEFTIPDTVTNIWVNAFRDCKKITAVNIPDNVSIVGDCVFGGCDSLASVTIGKGVTTIDKWAFSGCAFTSIIIPDSVTTIIGTAFNKCTALTDIKLSKNLTSIGDSAFPYCTSLTSLTIPDSIQTIGKNVFTGCDKLTLYCNIGNASEVLTTAGYEHKCFGDFDNDKKLSITDAVEMRRALMGDLEYDEIMANYNQDENFDARDLVRLKKELAGITM